MTLQTIAVNGVPIESYGLTPLNYEEWLSAPSVKYGTIAPIGRMGVTPTIAGISYTPKPLVLGAMTAGVDLPTDRASVGNWLLALQGRLEIESVDMPGRVITGQFEQGQTVPFGITLLSPQLQIKGTITCHDPFWVDRSPGTFGGPSGSRYVVPVGTAPSILRYWLCGPYTTPTVTLRDRTGVAIATMRFSDTAADNTIVLDVVFKRLDNAQRIDRYVSGVRSAVNNGYGYLNPADGFFTIDPLDAPTIEVDSGSLACIGWRGWQV